jgi:hypothetical protein
MLGHLSTLTMQRHLCVFICVSACLSLTGCVWPIPHTSQRSPEFRGRVLDAQTMQPIARARISLHERSSVSTTTASSGRFRLVASRNVYFNTLGPCPSEVPSTKTYVWLLDVAHPKYQEQTVDVLKHRDLEGTNNNYCAVDDILLIAKKP